MLNFYFVTDSNREFEPCAVRTKISWITLRRTEYIIYTFKFVTISMMLAVFSVLYFGIQHKIKTIPLQSLLLRLFSCLLYVFISVCRKKTYKVSFHNLVNGTFIEFSSKLHLFLLWREKYKWLIDEKQIIIFSVWIPDMHQYSSTIGRVHFLPYITCPTLLPVNQFLFHIFFTLYPKMVIYKENYTKPKTKQQSLRTV